MSLFENTDPTQDPDKIKKPAETPAPEAIDQLLAGIKNEQGEQKYSTVEEALKGLGNAQDFIGTLKTEKAEMQTRLLSQEELQELLNARPKDEPAAPSQAPATIDPKDIIAVVQQHKADQDVIANIDKVKQAFTSAFGAEANVSLESKVVEAGLTKEVADAMAATAPEALLKLLGIQKQHLKPSLVGGAPSDSFVQPTAPEPYKFIQDMQKNNPTLEGWREAVKETNAQLGVA